MVYQPKDKRVPRIKPITQKLTKAGEPKKTGGRRSNSQPGMPVTKIPKEHRSSRRVVVDRVDTILSLILGGKRRAVIQAFAKEEKWGVSTRMVDKYIEQANARRSSLGHIRLGRSITDHIAELENLYQLALSDKDFNAARKVMEDLERLCGHTPAKRIESVISGPDGGPVQVQAMERLPHEDRVKLLRELGGAGPPVEGFAIASAGMILPEAVEVSGIAPAPTPPPNEAPQAPTKPQSAPRI